MKWLILFDENFIRGGLQTCCRELATLVIEHGGKVDFVCTQKNPFGDLAAAFPDACRVTESGLFATRSLRPAALQRAWRILRETRPDVMFFCTTGMPNFLPLLAAAPLAGVKRRVVHFGTAVADPYGRAGTATWGREFHLSAKWALRSMTLGLFNNESQMNGWRTAYDLRRPCRIWNYPVDLSRFRPSGTLRASMRQKLGIANDEFVIGGVGALNAQKAFDLAVRALAEVRDRIPRARLIIAGEGDRRTLHDAAEECGVADRLMLLGDRDDVAELMNAFDVFCMPSTHPNETLGIVFVEAQACGVPIVAPDLPGPRRVAGAGKCGIVVQPGSPSALAQAWSELYENPAKRQSLIDAGLDGAKAFDRQRVFQWLTDELQLTLAESAKRSKATCQPSAGSSSAAALL